jgi:hypothetical protein
VIRTDAQLSVSRFAELIGVPRRTYTWRLARHRAEGPVGVWPAPVVDRIEPTVAKYAQEWPAWGHRKIWALARADGHDVGSQASVARALRRRGLLQPVRYQAERRQLAQARRAVFVGPPTRRRRDPARCPLILDCVDDQDRLWPVVVVTDNGPAMKPAAVAAWFEPPWN